MNVNLKIILCGCLAIAICFTMISAATGSSITNDIVYCSTWISGASVAANEPVNHNAEKPGFDIPVTMQKAEFPSFSRKNFTPMSYERPPCCCSEVEVILKDPTMCRFPISHPATKRMLDTFGFIFCLR